MKFIKAEKQAEIFAVIYIRKIVFNDEQNVSIDEEYDMLDFEADHFLIQENDDYIGTCRIFYNDKEATIGRVAVIRNHRNKGYAKFMMENAIEFIKKQDIDKIHIGAQVQALGFYEKLGFIVSGELYLDANIEHYPMELLL